MTLSIPRNTWPIWPYQLFLTILFFGPPAAALFIATGVPIMTDLGWLARDLLTYYVCPTPDKSYMLFDAPMAVCTRCWGATIGLWSGWFAVRHWQRHTHMPRWFQWHWSVRFMSAAVPFGLWWLEIAFWPSASYELLLVNGAFAGATAGVFFCSLWPGLIRQHA